MVYVLLLVVRGWEVKHAYERRQMDEKWLES